MYRKPYEINKIFIDLDGILASLYSYNFFLITNDKTSHFLRKKNLKIFNYCYFNTEVISLFNKIIYFLFISEIEIVIITNRSSDFFEKIINFKKNEVSNKIFSIISYEKLVLPNVLKNASSLFISNSCFFLKSKSILGLIRVYFNNFIDCRSNSTFKYDFIINNLLDLYLICKKGVLFNIGKLPNKILNRFLLKYNFKDYSIIVGPSVGEDTTAIDVINNEIVVLKSDPITFITNEVGYYSIIINSNDMVTAGSNPKWMLTTLLFPVNTSFYNVERIFKELHIISSYFGIVICGGHTEITDSVSKSIVISTMLGVVKRNKLINKSRMDIDDLIVMTKGVAIEGSSIIISEFKDLLLNNGMGNEEIKKYSNLKFLLSILPESNIINKCDGISGLHDITEGGVINCLFELCNISSYGINIYIDNIFVFSKTKSLCNLLNITPMGLIGSGTLLISCRPCLIDILIHKLNFYGIPCVVIGRVVNSVDGVKIISRERRLNIPNFNVDEITKLFEL